MLETILKYLGAGDAALTLMGPVLTIALAWAFGGALTQLIKFPLSKAVNDGWFEWTVRAFAVAVTAGFAHVLSDALHWSLELGTGFAQPIAYKLGLSAVRHWWPWLECSRLIGAVTPPAAAVQAAAQRRADRDGRESGA
jgi:hypothetical protein